MQQKIVNTTANIAIILQINKFKQEKMKKLVEIINKVKAAITEEIASEKAAGSDYAHANVRDFANCEIEVTVSADRVTEVIIYHYDEDGTLNEHQSPLLEDKIASELPEWYDVDCEDDDPRNDFEKCPSLANGWFFKNQW